MTTKKTTKTKKSVSKTTKESKAVTVKEPVSETVVENKVDEVVSVPTESVKESIKKIVPIEELPIMARTFGDRALNITNGNPVSNCFVDLINIINDSRDKLKKKENIHLINKSIEDLKKIHRNVINSIF